MKSGDPVATGTGPARRRLTEAEAQAGGLPERFTRLEWAEAFLACAEYVPRDNRHTARLAVFWAQYEVERAWKIEGFGHSGTVV